MVRETIMVVDQQGHHYVLDARKDLGHDGRLVVMLKPLRDGSWITIRREPLDTGWRAAVAAAIVVIRESGMEVFGDESLTLELPE